MICEKFNPAVNALSCTINQSNRKKVIMKLLKRISCGILALSLIVGTIACSQDNSSQTPSSKQKKADAKEHYGGQYRAPLLNNPATLDPARIEDIYGISVAYQIYDGLVQFGPYLSIAPAVAENWEVLDNGKKIRFFLRPNATFHHGRKVTTRDVIFTLQRLLRTEPPPFITPHLLKIKGAQAYHENATEHVEGLQPIDNHLLEIGLMEPYVPLLGALAMFQAAIVPEDVVLEDGDAFGRAPIGCGPFRFVEWKNDQSIILERHDKYYAGPSLLDGIHYEIFPGVQLDLVLEAFQSRRLHEMPVYGAVRQQLAQSESLHWIHRPSLSLLYYGINTRHPGLNDLRLRKAIALAIDRKQLVETVYNGQFEPAYSVIPPGMPAHNRNVRLVSQNVVEARALIEEVKASTSNGEPVIEIVSGSKSAFAQAELDFIKKALAAIGVKMSPKYIAEWPRFESYLESDRVQVYRYSWTADIPDPDNFLYPLFGKDSPVNRTGYLDSQIESALTQAAGMVDPVQRAQMYQKIEKQVMQAYPIIPLFYLSIDRVYQPDVKGITVSALGAQAVRLHRVWLSSNER
jgi:ABC-type transport system substrate-binding protein